MSHLSAVASRIRGLFFDAVKPKDFRRGRRTDSVLGRF